MFARERRCRIFPGISSWIQFLPTYRNVSIILKFWTSLDVIVDTIRYNRESTLDNVVEEFHTFFIIPIGHIKTKNRYLSIFYIARVKCLVVIDHCTTRDTMVIQIEVCLTVHIIWSAWIIVHVTTIACYLINGGKRLHLLPFVACNHIFPLGNLAVHDANGVCGRNTLCHLLLQTQQLHVLRRDDLVVESVTQLIITVDGDIFH